MREREEDSSRRTLRDRLDSRFLEQRKIFIWGEINSDVSEQVVKKLLFLESEDEKADVTMYINSPGGVIPAGLAIYDTMQGLRCDVSTVCLGHAASMAAVLLCSGKKGKRRALPHSRITIHQPLLMGQMYGPATDIGLQAEEMVTIADELNRILAEHTGQKMEKIAKDTDRDYHMSAQEAKQYGIIDEVISRG